MQIARLFEATRQQRSIIYLIPPSPKLPWFQPWHLYTFVVYVPLSWWNIQPNNFFTKVNPSIFGRPINRTVTIDLSSRSRKAAAAVSAMPLGVFHNTNWLELPKSSFFCRRKICCLPNLKLQRSLWGQHLHRKAEPRNCRNFLRQNHWWAHWKKKLAGQVEKSKCCFLFAP